jgi:isocitrate dehydrogenase kinase/phosphatase
MLDSIIFYKLRLPKKWFDQELLSELLTYASHSIEEEGKTLMFRYLIVQRKLTPLPVFLETASQKQAETIMVNLGYCIRNNAAANIFNKDLDARNYGVTTYSKVYLYDYDAIEALGDVKVRTNLDRFDGEEDIPDWYFEDGFVFLPEELPSGLCLSDRGLRRIFEDRHHALLTCNYWEDIQTKLAGGKVPRVSVYPDSERISGSWAEG